MIKRLMNVVTIIAIPIFIFFAYAAKDCENCEKPLSVLVSCLLAILIELVINYVVYSKFTLWHKKQDM